MLAADSGGSVPSRLALASETSPLPETPPSSPPRLSCCEAFGPPTKSRIEQESWVPAICLCRRARRFADILAIDTDAKDLCRD
ncbi:hypothetical protein [Bosea vaviloviae]|uniref:Uncharacterized protein n=1 Tax=Bosea vaviloviae TaxID=1526658 RepID=A0A1D7U8G5_9HYPH|nr:hypothetical protein [Bosea vaviloviae]AOO83675.1 hypothetical protein BHK69_27400 [Bosea vaviloviae]